MIYVELEANYLLPAIRREIVKLMVKKGVLKNEIANKLHLTKAAISQYISGKRSKFVLESSVVKECCDNIIAGNDSIIEINKLIKKLKESRKICSIYKQNSITPDDCKFCSQLHAQ